MNFLVYQVEPKDHFFRTVSKPVVCSILGTLRPNLPKAQSLRQIMTEADGFGLPSETAAGEGRTVSHVPSPSAL